MDAGLLNLTRAAQMVHAEKLASEYTQQAPSPPSAFDLVGASGPYNNSAADLSFGADPALQSVAAMREMIFRVAAMQPVDIDPESVKPPKRRNVKISKDPQSVAARRRRERISERIRVLQRLVPGGTKMDTAWMLDEAVHYVKFLKAQVQSLERTAATGAGFGFSSGSGLMAHGNNNNNNNYSCFGHAYTNVELSSSARLILSKQGKEYC